MKKVSLIGSLGIMVVNAVFASPNWKGQDPASTEWATRENWTANDGNHYYIDGANGATHYNMTFNRDGRVYEGDPEDKSDGNWDFYNIWAVTIRGMTQGEVVTWTGDGEDFGPNIRSCLYVGNEQSRGALAINGGKVTVEDTVRVGWGSPNVGELIMNGGLLNVRKSIFLGMDSSRARGTITLKGGTLQSEYLYSGNEMGVSDNYSVFVRGKGAGKFRFDGGTIKISANRQSYPVDGATFGEAGLTVDTAGNNATLTETINATVVPNATTITKKGEGTLTLDAPLSSGKMKVDEGTLKFATDGKRTLVHRWSFSSDATDSITGEGCAETLGNVTYENGKAVLAGGQGFEVNDDCGINLGPNKWPSDAMTIEIWATYRERTKWAKMFCWSGMQYSFQDDGGWSKFSLLGEGGTENLEATGGNIDAGSYNCYTITLMPNGVGGTHIRLCRWDVSNGQLINSRDYDAESWLVSKINQENFWLGKSYWGGDSAAKADYDEVRIWKGVFADTELKEHVLLGPDTLPGTNAKANTLNDSASDKIKVDDYLMHRWTFNGTYADMVGGSTATPMGNVSINEASSYAKLPGGTKGTGWIDLGECCAFPTNDTPFTIEIWTTVHEYSKNRRIFSFGKRPEGASNDYNKDSHLEAGIHTYFADGDSEGSWWRVTTRANGSEKGVAGAGWFKKDEKYHIAATFIPDGNGNTTCHLYSYKANNDDMVGMRTEVIEGWTPSMVNEVAGKMCCWLGHSQWGDNDAFADFDEVRIWNCALTTDQLHVNRKLGPDRLPHIMLVNRDSKFDLEVKSGATADFSGYDTRIANLSGSGTVMNDAITTVDGVLSPGGDDSIGTLTFSGKTVVTGTIRLNVNDKIVVDGEVDLSNAKIELMDQSLPEKFVFASATLGVTGTPIFAGEGDWGDYQIKVVDNEVNISYRPTVIFIR